MTSTRTALAAATAALALWGLKGVAIGSAGGLGESPAEGPLFFLGLLAAVVASAALATSLVPGRARFVRVLAAVAGPVLAIAVAAVLDRVAQVLRPATDESWVWSEVGLWALALLLLGAAASRAARDPRRTATGAGLTRDAVRAG